MRAAILCASPSAAAWLWYLCSATAATVSPPVMTTTIPAIRRRRPLRTDADGSVPAGRSRRSAPRRYPGGVYFRVWAAARRARLRRRRLQRLGRDRERARRRGHERGIFGGDVAGAAVGQEYAYVVTLADGTSVTHANPRARRLTASANGHAVIVDPAAYAWQTTGFQPAPFNDTVVYELHIGTFVRAAPTTIGTCASAATKLDYLAGLGINAVEVMPPVMCSSDTTWGYNPSWPFATHNPYGSPDDAKAFIDAAHAHGIAVYIDIVHNHYSSKNGLTCWDGDCSDKRLLLHRQRAQIDAVGPAPQLLRRQRARLHPRQRRRVARRVPRRRLALGLDHQHPRHRLGRDLGRHPRRRVAPPRDQRRRTRALARQAANRRGPADLRQASRRPRRPGGFGFDTQWDAAFFHPVDDNIVAAADTSRSMAAISGAITHAYNGAATQRVVYTEDHDEVANGKSRIPEMISPGNAGSLAARQRSTLGAAVVMTAPGIPMIFMGQEFLESGHFDGSTPLDWSKTTTYAGILALYKDLIALRHNAGGHTRGLLGKNVAVFHVNEGAQRHRLASLGRGRRRATTSSSSPTSAPSRSRATTSACRARARGRRASRRTTPLFARFPGDADRRRRDDRHRARRLCPDGLAAARTVPGSDPFPVDQLRAGAAMLLLGCACAACHAPSGTCGPARSSTASAPSSTRSSRST